MFVPRRQNVSQFVTSTCRRSDESVVPGNCLTLLAALVLALAPACIAHAKVPGDERARILAEGIAAFDEGTGQMKSNPDAAVASFRVAADRFESLIADGVVNGKLYYNLGNTYLQLGHVGKAVLNYRRAEHLIGGDPQLDHNLRYARSLRRNNLPESGQRAALETMFFWHYDTSIKSRYAVAVGAYLVFWGLLLAGSLTRRAGPRIAAVVALVFWLSAGTSVAVEVYNAGHVRQGVTTSSDIVVRKGNGEGYDQQFKESLHEGVEFTVVDQRRGWYKIELPDGSRGWIKQSQAELI